MADNEVKVHIDEFADKIAAENGLTKTQAKDFISGMFDVMGKAVADGEPVKIHNFGSFEKKWVDERNGVNPATHEKIIIPAHNKVVFKPYKKLASLVNLKYRNLKPNVIDALLTLTGVTKVTPDFIREIDSDKEKKDLWAKARKRALIILAVLAAVLFLLLAALITIPVVIINENNKVVRYVNSINKIFGLDKITDRFKGELNEEGVKEFFDTAKTKLTANRKIIEEYTVKEGDNIYNIAKRYWGNEYLWPDLYIINKEKINDPDLIRKNDKLIIYEKLGDPEKFSKKQRDDIVYAYIGIYRIYKALGEMETAKGNSAKGNKRINDSRWTLYTAVRYDNDLLDRYKDAIYPDDREFVLKQIERFGIVPEKD